MKELILAVHFLRRCCLVVFLILVLVEYALAKDYFVDFDRGSDNATGETTISPFRHAPGDPSASGIAANVKLLPGDTVYFKGGVVYKGTIVVPSSGAEVTSGSQGKLVESHVLVDEHKDFSRLGVLPGDYVYVFNERPDGANVESVGLGKIDAVSPTSLSMTGFQGLPSQNAALTYKVIRPISYVGHRSWGTGPAVLSGERKRDEIFHLNGKGYIRIANLTLTDLRDIPADACTQPTGKGAIWDKAEVVGAIFEDLTISNVWSGIRVDRLSYGVVRNNTIRDFGFVGLTPGKFGLAEGNRLENGLSGIRSAQSYTVIRFNTLIDLNKIAAASCGFHSDGIGPLFSPSADPGSNSYGWIYSNFISNTVMGIFLEYNNGGTRGWTIHSNILVGHQNAGGAGTSAIALNTAPETKVYNNTIVGIDKSSGWITALKVINSPNVEFVNNIVYSRTSVAAGINLDKGSVSGFLAEGNVYFTPERANIFKIGTTSMNWDQWRQNGYDVSPYSRFNEDPLFASIDGFDSEALDLRLQRDIRTPYVLSIATRDFAGFLRGRTSVNVGAHELTKDKSSERPDPPSNLRILTP